MIVMGNGYMENKCCGIATPWSGWPGMDVRRMDDERLQHDGL